MTIPQNPFEWTWPRHETFQLCLRRYWFAYYAAWGGWLPDAPDFSRRVYGFKRLSTGMQWTGHHIHAIISRILRERAAFSQDHAESMIASALESMRREFRDSRVGLYRSNPARLVGLFEHEYNIDLPPAEWKALVDRVPSAIRNFCSSPLFASLRSVPDSLLLDIPRHAGFDLSGLHVTAAPDLAIRNPDGSVVIYDWKTGSTPLAENRTQQGLYVLLALSLGWASDPAAVTSVAHHLISEESIPFSFSSSDLDDLRGFIRDSADEMLFPLDDPSVNSAPSPDPFDPTSDSAPCPSCPFLALCPRWTQSPSPS